MAQHKYQPSLEKAVATLDNAIAEIKTGLPDEMAALRIGVVEALTLQRNRVNGLLGEGSIANTNSGDLPPITTIFGVPVKMERQPVTSDHLKPNDDEKTLFLAALDTFYKEFPSLQPEQINQLIQMPGGEVKVRALAQKVGIGDYKDREINTLFIDEIKRGIVALNKYDAEQKAALNLIDASMKQSRGDGSPYKQEKRK